MKDDIKKVLELLLQVYELHPQAAEHCGQYISYEQLMGIKENYITTKGTENITELKIVEEKIKTPEENLVEALKQMFGKVVEDKINDAIDNRLENIEEFFSGEKIWNLVYSSRGFAKWSDNELERLIEDSFESSGVSEEAIEKIVDDKLDCLDISDMIKEHGLQERDVERIVEEAIDDTFKEVVAQEVLDTIVSRLRS